MTKGLLLMNTRILRTFTLLASLFLLATETLAVLAPGSAPLPNFDTRIDNGRIGAAPLAKQGAAVATLQSRLPQAHVDFEPFTGAPKLVSAGEQFLSGPNGQGKAIAAAVAAGFPAADPNRATKAFLSEYAGLFGHGPEALDQARVAREFATPHSGMRTVVWEQQVEGIPVFEAVLISHTTRQGELVNLSSQFLPDPTAAADQGVPNWSAVLAAPQVSARQAVALAARNLGEEAQEETISPVEPGAPGTAPANPEQRQEFKATAIAGTASARLIWLPVGRDRLDLCWDVVLAGRTRSEMYRLLIQVQTGEVLLRRCLTDYLSDATYRVFTSDSPSPFSPAHSTPSSIQPAVVDRALLTFSALSTNASPDGWIDDGVNETRGNNADAHTDWNNDNQPDLPRPQGSPSRVFDFALDLAQSPTSYSSAAVAQLFYWNNFMHDRLYELGFTEAAGNFQNNNFGRGGLGGDAVQADAQDGGGYNNANFSTPPDGFPGRMQMYRFNGPTPDRDGDLDAEVILHEYTHGLSNRRVGGGVGISALQSAGMGEGWSDFYPLALLSESGDDVNGVYPTGAYLTYLLSGLTQNYYYGIRRYPYCTDMSKNPLTFKDIDPAQASSHPGVPRSPIIGGAANEVHNMGEVWCVTLWEARANLINKHGWAEGHQLILQLVTDGMNLSPPNPNYLQARDAILQADLVATGGANRAELWAAFARRGMGYSATSPSSSTTGGVHEAFDVPDALLILPALLSASGPPGGPFVPNPAFFVLTNSGSNTLTWSLANTSTWVNASPAGGELADGAAANVAVAVTAAADSFTPGIYTAGLWFTNQTSGVVQYGSFALAVVGRHMFDDFDPGIDLSQWSAFGGVVGSTVLATNYGGSVSGPNSLWFGDGGSRYATTLPINTTSGGVIGFSIRLGSGSAWPWEEVDSFPSEGVVLECSTNSGLSWVTLDQYASTAYYDWTAVTLAIPAAAQAPATLFRWRQLSHSGAIYDHWALDNVITVAEDMAPEIVAQPQSRNVAVGDPATLTVQAFGTQPLTYQWFKNATPLAGATASSLAWTNTQMTDAGTYSILVSNRVGTATSSNAVLSVYIPVCVPPSPGLVSWWAAEGNTLDAAGVNDGVFEGTAVYAKGKVGNAFDLNGTSQYVEVPHNASLNPTTSVSVEAWIFPRSPFASTVPPIIKKAGEGLGQEDGYALELYDTGAAAFAVYVDGGTGWSIARSSPLSPNEWAHVVGVYDGTNVLLYVNGVQAATPVFAPGQIVPSGNNLQIGHDPSNPPRYFSGLIDEPSVYSSALSASQIQALYYASTAGKCQPTNPPTILTQPESQTVAAGANVSLSVNASGFHPLSYQWLFDGTNLIGASNATLLLTNVQVSSSGTYAVVVSNAYGMAVSSNAVLTVSIAPCTPLQSGVVSWWAAEANAADWVGSNNGLLQNGLAFAPGRVGQAFNLNGTSQYVDVPSSASLNPTASLSIEAWIYPRSPLNSVAAPIIKKAGEGTGQSHGYTLEFAGSSGVVFGVYVSGGRGWAITAPAPVTLNRWSHVAGVYDGTSVSIYVNGAIVGAPVVAPGQIVPSGNNLQTGHDPSNPPRYFNGLIDEASVYNMALSAQQILAIYNAGSAGKCPPTLSPTILTQPQDQTVPVGATVNFDVLALGASPLAYQWEFNGTNLTGASNALLTLANVQVASSGTYAVVITNLYGSTTSSPASLAVLVPPQITSQPQDQVATVGTNVTFTAVAKGSDPLAYQWYFNGVSLALETNATLVLSNVSAIQGGLYRLLVTNSVGSASSRDASLVVLGTGLCIAPPAGIVSWWAGEADAFDSIGTNYGTLQNDVGFAAGKVGQAFDLNGTSQYVNVPNSASLNPTAKMSVECWLYPRAPLNPVAAPVIKKAGEGSYQNHGYSLEFAGASGVIFTVFVDGGRGWIATAPAPVSTGQWSHVAGVYDGTNVSIYVNGLMLGTPVAGAGQIVASGNPLQIGHDPSNSSRYFNGLIDEVSVYDTALSAAQIQAIHSASAAGKCQPDVPPSLLVQPQSQTVAAGTSPAFNVLAAGTRPLVYQWRFNGTSLPAACSSALTLTNVQVTDSGSYDVVITNLHGSTTSSAAILTVLVPPQITNQPQHQIVAVGAQATFAVGVAGSSPLRYQWYFNGAPLNSATNPILVLSNVSLVNAGAYTVTVTNVIGTASSSAAFLSVLDNSICIPPLPGLAGWWAAEGNALDSAGSNDGTLRNGLACVPGRVGQAFNLNGTSQYVDVPSSASLNPTASLSVEAWVYPRSPLNSVAAPIIKKAGEGTGQSHGYTLEFAGTSGVILAVSLGGGGWFSTAPAPVPMEQWSHVAGVFDGANVSIYVNGTLVGSPVAAPGQIVPSGNNLQIGRDPSNPSRYFNGLIDEPSVYSTALSASEIAAIYNAGSAGKCQNHAPTARNVTAATGKNQPISIPVEKLLLFASDPDGDPLTVSAVSPTSTNGAPVALNAGLITYAPVTNFIGTDRFSYTVSDGRGGSASAYVQVLVRPADQLSANMLVPIPIQGGWLVAFAGIPGRTYSLQRAEAVSGPWTLLNAVLVGPSGIATYSDTNAPPPEAYYRTVYP